MGWLRRPPEPAFRPGDRYHGAAIFREGFYYPILNDEHSREIGPANHMPLVWRPDLADEKGGYLVHASPDDPNHFHAFGFVPVDIAPAVEEW